MVCFLEEGGVCASRQLCGFLEEHFTNWELFNPGMSLPQTDGEHDSVFVHCQGFSISNINYEVMPHLSNPNILAISLAYRCARRLPAAPSMDHPWTLSLDNSKNLPFVSRTSPTGMGKEVVRNTAQLKKALGKLFAVLHIYLVH